jgi:hypothetical protein
MSMRLKPLSRVAMRDPGVATAPLTDGKLLAWILLAGVLVAIAIFAVAVAPAPDPDTAMNVIGS